MCLYAQIQVCSHLHVHTRRICVYVHICMCIAHLHVKAKVWGWVSSTVALHFLKKGVSLDPELDNSASPAGQIVQGIACLSSDSQLQCCRPGQHTRCYVTPVTPVLHTCCFLENAHAPGERKDIAERVDCTGLGKETLPWIWRNWYKGIFILSLKWLKMDSLLVIYIRIQVRSSDVDWMLSG